MIGHMDIKDLYSMSPLFLVFAIRLVYIQGIMCKSDTFMFCMFLGKKTLGVP